MKPYFESDISVEQSQELELLGLQVTTGRPQYEGYPRQKILAAVGFESETTPTFPDGPWCASVDQLPTESEQRLFVQGGYLLDKLGRPIHPWIGKMLTDKSLGVITNKGFYRKWGPNRTGDPIIISNEVNPRIALVLRSDNRKWALAGGFVDPADGTDPVQAGIKAAVREGWEELGLEEIFNLQPTIIYQGPVDDPRATAHAWPETTAVLLRTRGASKLHPNREEVIDAGWFELNEIPKNLHGSHGFLIEQTLKQI